MKDISVLVEQRFIDFFTNPDSEFIVKPTEEDGIWRYPEIMEEFKKYVGFLEWSVHFSGYSGESRRPHWALMRQKYFDGRDYVYPEEMITKLEEFDNRDCLAFLHYCVSYKERFCDGAYMDYSKEGYIGRILLRLSQLPLTIETEADNRE